MNEESPTHNDLSHRDLSLHSKRNLFLFFFGTVERLLRLTFYFSYFDRFTVDFRFLFFLGRAVACKESK